MTVRSLLGITVALLLAAACGQEEQPPAGQPGQPTQAQPETMEPPGQMATTPPETTIAEPAAVQPASEQPARQPVAAAPVIRTDTPYSTTFTGTVQPGMSEADVVGVWGDPVARRVDGTFVYLHYRNGCEVSCGMYDIVILDSDQVVDAVVRFEGHIYAGVSSSPPGQLPAFTPPDSLGSVDG